MTRELWLLVLGIMVALPVAAELGARAWIRYRRLYYVFPPGLRLHLQPDPEVFPELEPQVRFEVNSEGERGYPVPRVRSRERLYRVLVAGGSQPEGYALDQDTSWPCRLQRVARNAQAAAAVERIKGPRGQHRQIRGGIGRPRSNPPARPSTLSSPPGDHHRGRSQ